MPDSFMHSRKGSLAKSSLWSMALGFDPIVFVQ